MALDSLVDGFYGAVTVGERGQIVIPAGLREKQGINPGDKLLVFGHPSGHGLMLARLQDLQRMSELLEPILKGGADVSADEENPAASDAK